MQLKKRTSKPVPPPAKICSFLFGRSGFGLIGIMVAIVATGLLVVPLTRWYISMTSGAEGLQDKLAMQAIIQDHWLTLNDEGFDELSAAIATKGSTWTENVGEGGRYTITTSFGEPGKYVNAACTDGTPGTDERQCRKVSVQIKDNVTGQTQALNLTKVASQTDKRLKDLEARSAGLEGRMAQEEAWSGNFNSRISANESRFGQYYTAAQTNSILGNYYTAAQVNSKLGSYYTTAQVDQKIKNEGAVGQVSTPMLNYWGCAFTWGNNGNVCTSNIKSYCLGSAPASHDNGWNYGKLYNSAVCKFTRAGYSLPSNCYTLADDCDDNGCAHGYTCNLVCAGKNCVNLY